MQTQYRSLKTIYETKSWVIYIVFALNVWEENSSLRNFRVTKGENVDFALNSKIIDWIPEIHYNFGGKYV